MTYELATARTWAEIDVDRILFNYRNALGELSPGVAHFSVLKANAYGLGSVPIAKVLYAEGARLFAVACMAEAVELGKALPGDVTILIMGEIFPAEYDLLFKYPIQPTLFSLEAAKAISAKAAALGKTTGFQCKVDTGLNRLGLSTSEAVEVVTQITSLPGLRFDGLFSHLQRRSPDHDRKQAERLMSVRDGLLEKGIAVPMLHLLDSIGMWRYPTYQMNAVRDAAFILGHTPKDYPRPDHIRFALSIKTRIVRVFWADAGECLGYDSEHPLTERKRVATLAIGYADGYPRAMSHVGQTEIHGKRAKVLGVVCMDLAMVDVTDIPEAQVGDIATLLGGTIGIHEYAEFSNGYCNEYMTLISRRVPRVYLQDGKVVEIVFAMDES